MLAHARSRMLPIAGLRVPGTVNRAQMIAVKYLTTSTETIKDLITISIFIPQEKMKLNFRVKPTTTLIDLVHINDELRQYVECACEGNAICSTCHVHVDSNFAKLLDPPEEMELDILDLVPCFNQESSRLGCQIKFSAKCDGITLTIPGKVNNLL